MYKVLMLFALGASLCAQTIINLKNGTSIECRVVNVNPTVLQLSTNEGVMIKVIASIQTADTALIRELLDDYPQISSKKISAYSYLLDLSAIEVMPADETKDTMQSFIQSYAFNFMLNSKKRHRIELNARLITRSNWCAEIGYSHGSKTFTDAINAYNQNLTIDFSTESIAIGLGYRIDVTVGYLVPDINIWLSSSNASIPVNYKIPAEDDSLLIITDVNELVISPGLTFVKLDSRGLLQLMIGIRYFSSGHMLADKGWLLDEQFYPVDKKWLKRGFSIHVGIGLNLKVRE
jgi:hypothetical protein